MKLGLLAFWKPLVVLSAAATSAGAIAADPQVDLKTSAGTIRLELYPGKAPKLNPGQLAPDFIYERVTFGFGKMPAWKDVFSDEQRRGVVAYIKSRDFSP